MNFYIGSSINEIDVKDYNVEFSDELVDFIYKIRKNSLFDMSELTGIDSYRDTAIPKEDLPKIIEICKYIIKMSLLEGYEEQDEGNEMLHNLLKITQEALQKDSGLVVIGEWISKRLWLDVLAIYDKENTEIQYPIDNRYRFVKEGGISHAIR